jgi:NAD(P)-dependent dehydrogenase (short-subunit alcohol dehydrogenase family)
MTMRLADKVAVITGAARGIGAETARLFGREGAAVVIGDVLEAEGEATAAAIVAAGGRAAFQRADVSDPAQADALIAAAIERFGRLDVLVNNAGVLLGAHVPLAEFDRDAWRRVLEVNMNGTFYCTQAAAAHLPSGGVVLCVASGAGIRGGSSSLAYGASKAGIQGLAFTLDAQLRPRGIRVNVICPGNLVTEMKLGVIRAEAERAGGSPETAVARAMPELGDPAGVARVLLFLASDEGSYVVGTVFTR